jgi:hypothetical protein
VGSFNLSFDSTLEDANGFTLPPSTATASLSAGGLFQLTGTLPTGTPFSFFRTLSPDGDIFFAESTIDGVVTGHLAIQAGDTAPEISGSVYLNYVSFDQDLLQNVFVQVPLLVSGEAYVAPAAGASAVPLSDGTGTITITTYGDDDGDGPGDVLSHELVKVIALDTAGNITVTGANPELVTINLQPANGTYTGSFVNPDTSLTTSFSGVLLQSALKGPGRYELGDNVGPVLLEFQVGAIGD